MKAAGAFNGRPRELRTRHNMRAIYDKDTHKNRDHHPILRRSLLRTVGGKGERLSAVSSIALPGYLVRAVANLSSKLFRHIHQFGVRAPTEFEGARFVVSNFPNPTGQCF